MLVLSRKTGEEIVLPNCGVTIGVVAVNGKHVRLGIAAPAEIPIHRGEVWNRILETSEFGNGSHDTNRGTVPELVAESDEPSEFDSRLVAEGSETCPERVTTIDTPAARHHEIRRRIAERTHGHVVGLEVEVADGRLIVHGRTRSYYGKQLACAAALELIEALDPQYATHIELDIQVLKNR